MFTENNLLGSPCQTFNMNNSGMLLNLHVNGVAKQREHNPVAPSSGDKTQITVVGCISATGSLCPDSNPWTTPMIYRGGGSRHYLWPVNKGLDRPPKSLLPRNSVFGCEGWGCNVCSSSQHDTLDTAIILWPAIQEWSSIAFHSQARHGWKQCWWRTLWWS